MRDVKLTAYQPLHSPLRLYSIPRIKFTFLFVISCLSLVNKTVSSSVYTVSNDWVIMKRINCVGSGMTSNLHIFLDGLHKPKKDLIHYIVCVQPKISIQVGNVNTYAKVPN